MATRKRKETGKQEGKQGRAARGGRSSKEAAGKEVAAGKGASKGAAKVAEPEDMQVEGRYNRTGIGTAPLQAKRALEVNEGWSPPLDDPTETRASYVRASEPIGTVPPPTSIRGILQSAKATLFEGAKPTVLIDKLAERLAFERTGVRLYDALIARVETLGGYPGGPELAELRRVRGEELAHFHLLKDAMEQLGADPTAMTPSADIAAVESMGIGQVLGDPRTTVAQCLHAILVAELADNDGWQMLIDLVDMLGYEQWTQQFKQALLEEDDHLKKVRGWLSAHVSKVAKAAA